MLRRPAMLAATPSVALIDVARFREINEALGRARGDEVLLELGRRLADAAGTDAVVARLGGDEFALASFTTRDVDLRAWALRLQAAAAEPVLADGVPVLVEVAVGYYRAAAAEPVDELLVRVDAALGRAKASVDKCAGYVDRPDLAARTSRCFRDSVAPSRPANSSCTTSQRRCSPMARWSPSRR